MRCSMRKAFTLVELLVVVTVISILAALALYGLGRSRAAARDAQRQKIMNGIQEALARYYGNNQFYYYTPNNNFCGVVGVLVTGSYLSANPVDPNTKTALCSVCGTGDPVCGGATYRYLAGANGVSYTLTLVKESGGTSTFNSP